MADCGEKLVLHAARHFGLPSRLTRFLEIESLPASPA